MTLQYMGRALPNVIAKPFCETFGIDATGFGIFASCFYYPYMVLQVPVGIAIDRYGPVKILKASLSVFTVGALISAFCPSFLGVCVGRFVMGIGAAPAFIGTVCLSKTTFSAAWFPLVTAVGIGLSRASSMVLNAKSNAVMALPWSTLALFVLYGSVALLVPALFLKKESKEPCTQTFGPLVWEAASLLKNPAVRAISFYGLAFYLPMSVLAEAWLSSFLCSVYGSAANAMSAWLIFGSVLGSFCAGPLVVLCGGIRRVMLGSAVASIVLMSALFYAPPHDFATMRLLLIAVGFAPLGQALMLVAASEHVDQKLLGRVSGVVNALTMLGAALFQPLVGLLLNASRAQRLDSVYILADYRLALSIVPFCMFLALIVSWKGFLKPKKTHDHV